MIIKIYKDENISPEQAKTGWLSKEDDHIKRHGSLRPCIDGFLEYEINGEKGILLAYRDSTPPLPNALWVPGGEWKRGVMDPTEAFKLKIKEETNLNITSIEYLGMASILWKESPYNSKELERERNKRKLGEGIHDLAHVFFAKATGDLRLKTMKLPIVLVTHKNYDEIMTKYNLHDYLKVFIKEALKRIN